MDTVNFNVKIYTWSELSEDQKDLVFDSFPYRAYLGHISYLLSEFCTKNYKCYKLHSSSYFLSPGESYNNNFRSVSFNVKCLGNCMVIGMFDIGNYSKEIEVVSKCSIFGINKQHGYATLYIPDLYLEVLCPNLISNLDTLQILLPSSDLSKYARFKILDETYPYNRIYLEKDKDDYLTLSELLNDKNLIRLNRDYKFSMKKWYSLLAAEWHEWIAHITLMSKAFLESKECISFEEFLNYINGDDNIAYIFRDVDGKETLLEFGGDFVDNPIIYNMLASKNLKVYDSSKF